MNNEPVAYENTDKEIWRAVPNDYYSPSIFVTKENNIGINVGGRVYVKTVEQWHKNTHPVKELTDEEIKQAKLESWQQCKDTTEVIDFELSYQDELFARAILRKAQEK
jgi:hypothetical protein